MYHQNCAEVINENQIIKFDSEEKFEYIRINDGYLELNIEIKKVDNTIFTNADIIRLVNNGLAYFFQEGRLSISSGTEKENKQIRRSCFKRL